MNKNKLYLLLSTICGDFVAVISRVSIMDACLVLKETTSKLKPSVFSPVPGGEFITTNQLQETQDSISSLIHLEAGELKIGQMVIFSDNITIENNNVVLKSNKDSSSYSYICKYKNLLFANDEDELRDVIYELHRKANGGIISKRQFDALKGRLKAVKEEG